MTTRILAIGVGLAAMACSAPAAADVRIIWGVGAGSDFGLTFDVGAMSHGGGTAAFGVTSRPANPALAAGPMTGLSAEAARAPSDISEYEWYPVIALGVHYRF